MKINPVNNAKGDLNRYCGPAALSIVTGMATGEAARLLRHHSGKASIKGTTDGQMIRAFRACGVTMKPIYFKPAEAKVIRGKTETRPTLTQWLRDSQSIRTPGRVFLISAGHHWQIISGRRFCCGRTKAIVSITAKGTNRRARVENVYELTVTDKIIIPAVAKKPSRAESIDPYRKRLAALEREMGFKGKIVRFDSVVRDYVVPPCPAFPQGLSTMHHGWDETYGRVLHCTQPEVYTALADVDYHYSE